MTTATAADEQTRMLQPIRAGAIWPRQRAPSPASEQWVIWPLVVLASLLPVVAILLPLGLLFARSLSDAAGGSVGLANYVAYFQTPTLTRSLPNSLWIAGLSTLLSVGLGSVFAYGLTRTAMPAKGLLRTVAMLPLYAPPMVLAIALIYLFGNKGLVTNGLLGVVPPIDIGLYGPTGIVLAEVLYCFPQVLLIMSVSLRLADARLYEAATALRASPLRTFFTVTLPSIKYGLASATFVSFVLAFTDFGAPKVVGGGYPVLATDIFNQVIGQQNFTMGATVSMVLLIPTALAFAVDRLIQRRHVAALTTRAVPLQPRPDPALDRAMFIVCGLIALTIVVVLGMGLLASLVQVWPYDLRPTLRHYEFRGVAGGYQNFWNSIWISSATAIIGSAVIFLSAYLIEKLRIPRLARTGIYVLSMLPVALPGLALGLAYILLFNQPAWDVAGIAVPNPLAGLYGTAAILVLVNIVHFYTVGFVTATAALKQLDAEVEAVGSSLRVPFYRTFWRVTFPVCLPAVLETAMYLFVSSMVTVSAVIFLYTPELRLAAITVIGMDDAGDTAAAAAMSMLIVGACIAARLLYELATRGVLRRARAWTRA